VAERSIHDLWDVIGRIVDLYSMKECSNTFIAASCDADRSEIALEIRNRSRIVHRSERFQSIAVRWQHQGDRSAAIRYMA